MTRNVDGEPRWVASREHRAIDNPYQAFCKAPPSRQPTLSQREPAVLAPSFTAGLSWFAGNVRHNATAVLIASFAGIFPDGLAILVGRRSPRRGF